MTTTVSITSWRSGGQRSYKVVFVWVGFCRPKALTAASYTRHSRLRTRHPTLRSGIQPGGEVADTMLKDDSYRDADGTRIAIPAFKACGYTWYRDARRISKTTVFNKRLAEFTLEELACIDLQVRRVLKGEVVKKTDGQQRRSLGGAALGVVGAPGHHQALGCEHDHAERGEAGAPQGALGLRPDHAVEVRSELAMCGV